MTYEEHSLSGKKVTIPSQFVEKVDGQRSAVFNTNFFIKK